MHVLLDLARRTRKRITVEVLAENDAVIAFYHAVEFNDYAVNLE